MRVELEFWQVILLTVMFLGFVAGVGRFMFSQFEKRLDEKFKAMSDARIEADRVMTETIKKSTESEKKTADKVNELERTLLQFQAKLPLDYVRREDYIRKETVIEAKLDALYNPIHNMTLK